MDHGGHDMPMGPKCQMNMLWNTQIIDTCIVFRSWHIGSNSAFFWSCLAIMALGVVYEYLRVFQRKLDVHIALSLAKGKGRSSRSSSRGRGAATATGSTEGNEEELGLLSGHKVLNASLTGTPVPAVSRALRAVVYGATVFLSFFLMLVFMTYNAYLIFATVVGAALGHYIFGSTINVDSVLHDSTGGKGMACH
ncbi:Ctr copper transporter [Pholiota conissans]|uniref:Copper transport protein n=1 Tax=Pholiota conissans TaxID=109636 RepID=A0A9P5Z0L9_9AGAR|nr:Ctr copper transporter [Pholiota conissans]